MKPQEIKLGHIIFSAQQSGAHVHVRTQGDGFAGQRSLLGYLQMTPAEWASLVAMAEVDAEIRRRALECEVALRGTQKQIDALRDELAAIKGPA